MKKINIISNKRKNYKLLFLIILILVSLSILYIALDTTFKNTDGEKLDNTKHDLPIIIINTYGKKIEVNPDVKEVEINDRKFRLNRGNPKYKANLKLYEPNLYGEISIIKNKPSLETDIIMNIRGQSSLRYPKKQYTIRFIDKKDNKNPQEILKMAKHDKWVLNGLYSDKSLIRNYISYKMGRQIMDYAPDTRFVEVYMNNSNEKTQISEENYKGIYLLTEKIERGANRVNISKNNTKYKDISFIMARDKIRVEDKILESDWNQLEENYIIMPKDESRTRVNFTNIYPSSKNITNEQLEKITKYINAFEYSLKSSNFDDRRKGYMKYIDIDSFINYAMINEITKNIDGGEVSSYFYKDLGGVMKAGPIWDFDQSLGNTYSKDVNEPTGFHMVNRVWYKRLFQDELFVNRYKTNYKKYRNTIWTDKNIDKMIDEIVLKLEGSIEKNQKKWYPNSNIEDYYKEIQDIKIFLKTRLKWMDQNINSIKRIKENVVE